MSNTQDVARILHSFARAARTAEMPFQQLVAYTGKYLERHAASNPDLSDLEDNTENLLAVRLIELEKEKRLTVRYDGSRIVGVDFPEYYTATIHTEYGKIHDRPQLPFPTEESLEITIPNDLVQPIDVKSDFVVWLGKEAEESPRVLRLMFPDGLKSIIATGEMLPSTLVDVAVHKIRAYLRSERNVSYIRSKLSGVFRNREAALQEMLGKILTTPDSAVQTVLQPTDFSFHFWTTLSSVLIKDLALKKEKLQEEHDCAQSAYLLGYYNVYYKGVVQRKRETEAALQMLDTRLRKPPYAYTISDIYNFTDSKGVLLTKRYGHEDINDYLTTQVRADTPDRLAAMLRVKGPDDKEYFLRKEYALKVLIEGIFDASRELADHYVESWSSDLKVDRRPREMIDDSAFERDVQSRMEEQYPLLCALCRFDLIYLCANEQKVMGEAAAEINRILDRERRAVRPMHEVLQLDRQKLADDARLLLPFWQAIPWLHSMIRLFQRMLTGHKTAGYVERRQKQKARRGKRSGATTAAGTGAVSADSAPGGEPPAAGRRAADAAIRETTMQLGARPESATRGGKPSGDSGSGGGARDGATKGGTTRRVQAQEFKRRIDELQQSYVGKDGNVDATLEELIERWNPLLDPVAKANLVEDVNSLVRDFLRRMKVGFRLIPPDRPRIQGFAEKLSQSDVFDQIRRKDALKTYLELYMLKVMGKLHDRPASHRPTARR